ncbi:MAG: Gfo/Idh/MocA family oxidoreductase [Phycisphaerae bacterium]|nr:Gfo/Idh/MocA family oxidoreductase [Phycisphaerae bacterium]
MADTVKIGMIGCGQIAKIHLGHYDKIPEAEIVALCDVNEAEAKRIAAERGIKHVFTDYNDLLAMNEIQSVDVCLHNRLHAPVTIDALRAGKNVYCEKPMAATYAEAKRMREVAAETGRMLAIQFFSLYDPPTRAAKKLIDQGRLGQVYYAKARSYRRRGRPFVDGYGTAQFVNSKTSAGGALLDMCVYHTARMVYLLGNPDVLTVSGRTFQQLDMYDDRRKSSGYDVEEFGLGLIRLAGDVTLFVEEAWAVNQPAGASHQIFGSKGGLQLEPFKFHTTIDDIEFDATADLNAVDWRWHQCVPGTGDVDGSQRHWISAQLGRCDLIDSAGVALKTMMILEGIYKSHELSREVTAAEIEAGA